MLKQFICKTCLKLQNIDTSDMSVSCHHCGQFVMVTIAEVKLEETSHFRENWGEAYTAQVAGTVPYEELLPQDIVTPYEELLPQDRKCPTCNSPSPELHPAMQYEGEVEICKDRFHPTINPNIKVKSTPEDLQKRLTEKQIDWEHDDATRQKMQNEVFEQGAKYAKSKQSVYDMVLEFHKTYGCQIGDPDELLKEKYHQQETYASNSTGKHKLIGDYRSQLYMDLIGLRDNLLNEELKELREGQEKFDIVEIADGIGDAIYILIGTAIAYGIPIMEVLAEIHRSNMSKLGEDGKPIMREDGKVLKGPNYFKPDIRKVLIEHMDKWVRKTVLSSFRRVL